MTMTGSADPTSAPPPPPPTTPPAGRRLRRSRSNRVGAGVAAGLGEYFGFDPVLFRVLFATAAFFGGAGIVAYALAWAAIPDEGTERAAVDGWIAWLRRHRVPLWAVAIAGGLLLWAVAFSWWSPHFFLPLIAVVVLLVVAFGRQGRTLPPGGPGGPAGPGGATTPTTPTSPTSATTPMPPLRPVDLSKSTEPTEPTDPTAPVDPHATYSGPVPPAGPPTWRTEAGAWVSEARRAAAERRRRAAPIRIATVIVLVVTLVALGLADAYRGIVLPVYFWVTLGIVGAALLAGLGLRRTPWSLALLLIPAVGGLIAFGNTRASLHDGIGERRFTPVAAPAADYKLAFGQQVLDLRRLAPQSGPRTISMSLAAGQVHIIAPRTLNLVVDSHVRMGEVTVDGAEVSSGGFDDVRQIPPPAGASGPQLVVRVQLDDGQLKLTRTG